PLLDRQVSPPPRHGGIRVPEHAGARRSAIVAASTQRSLARPLPAHEPPPRQLRLLPARAPPDAFRPIRMYGFLHSFLRRFQRPSRPQLASVLANPAQSRLHALGRP